MRDMILQQMTHLLVPLFIGTALHLLIVNRRGSNNGILGWISLGAISVFTGLLFRYVGVAYYKFNKLDLSPEIVDFLLVIGSTIGFGGFMFAISKVDDFWSKLMDRFLGRYEPTKRRKYDDDNTTGDSLDYFDK